MKAGPFSGGVATKAADALGPESASSSAEKVVTISVDPTRGEVSRQVTETLTDETMMGLRKSAQTSAISATKKGTSRGTVQNREVKTPEEGISGVTMTGEMMATEASGTGD